MLSLLDTINHFLGYFNINNKPRNRIYTIIATVGNFYLLYLSIEAFRYQRFLRGSIYVLIFLVLLYFSVLNIIYYFTNKKAKFDISPKIEKLLGGPPKEALAQSNGQQPNNLAQPAHAQSQVHNIPTTGIFSENSLVPAEIIIDDGEQANLVEIVNVLKGQTILATHFNQDDDTAIQQQLQRNETVMSLKSPLPIPFFDLQIQADSVEILAGLNALTAKPVGHLARVGLSSIDNAIQAYDLALANLQVSAGPQKVLNQAAVTEIPRPYKLQAQVAFKPKERSQMSSN
ncbi:DUF6681 family protein [Agrilactobacillus fermenti]|uniref:DUF6681 family protein n=1 Tax=Agrilactobacillus fermenti TaxID=2586909 RepID=UPI001E4CB3FC|nr:DUF6681 family protein [Agrilactobacillus fermenti]MCD2256118.1 hypothetical protein [Agrilactobacillus fermenti]